MTFFDVAPFRWSFLRSAKNREVKKYFLNYLLTYYYRPEMITSRDAESACFEGSRTSCDLIIFGIFWAKFWPENMTSRDGCFLREENSMDQCRSRPKLSENFECHWSIPISGEIHMDQSLVHTFSWGNSYGPMVLKVPQINSVQTRCIVKGEAQKSPLF